MRQVAREGARRGAAALLAFVSIVGLWAAAWRPPAALARAGDASFPGVTAGQAPVADDTVAAFSGGRAIGTDVIPWAPPVPGFRIQTEKEGIYRLGYDRLLAAGVPVGALGPLGPSGFQLYHDGQEVAIWVEGEGDGSFDPSDAIVFYGQAAQSKHTKFAAYWLTYGHAAGKRMTTRDGTPGGAGSPTSHSDGLHLETNTQYMSSLPGDEGLERFLWAFVGQPWVPSWSTTFSLAAPDVTQPGVLSVMLYGYDVSPMPRAQVYLSPTLLYDATWPGGTWHLATFAVPPGLLKADTNTLTVATPNAGDQVYVDWADLSFANSFTAVDDVLAFSYGTPGTWLYAITGFAAADVAVFDVTDAAAVEQITGANVSPSGSGFAVAFQDQVSAGTDYWAGTTARFLEAGTIEQDIPSSLGSALNGADYVIITHRDFAAAVQPLATYRASLGMRVLVADVQDVYDEFGFGVVGPYPIRDMLEYAYHHWQLPRPKYVLLVGDGHYDPKDFLGYGRTSYIPPYLAPVDPWMVETASDNLYVTVDGDDRFPDMIIGRLPVNSVAETETMVAKTLQYEQQPTPGDWRSEVLFVADNADGGGDFAAISDDLISCCLPPGYDDSRVYYLKTHLTVAAVRQAIVAAINQGRLIVNYVGHAATATWAAERFFRTSDIGSLTNSAMQPIMLSMTCKDGYFVEPLVTSGHSMAESLVRASGKGAVAAWSPSGLGVSTGHDLLNKGFFDAYLSGGVSTLGEAVLAGKQNLWDSHFALDLLDTYNLFGDPALRIVSPASIGDRVWLDEDGDGTQDAGEAGIASIGVDLYDSTGAVHVATTVTDSGGGYLFVDLLPGTYVLKVDTTTLPAGLAANPTFDPDGATDHETSVTAAGGQEHLAADFGYNWVPATDTTEPPPGASGAIGDRLWIDADGDGTQDGGEAGLPGIPVVLWYDSDADGAVDAAYGMTTTGPGGGYIFDGVPAGLYQVIVNGGLAPTGYTQTGDPDDTFDNQTLPIPQAPGDAYLNADFGYRPAAGSAIGGLVYLSLDGDGMWSLGEPGIPRVTVALLDGTGFIIATTTTGADGSYRFEGLPAGTYTVWVNDTHHMLERLAQIGDPDGTPDNRHTLVVDGVSAYPARDLGYVPLSHGPGEGLIGDTIFLDVNPLDGNAYVPGVDWPLEGVRVNLYAGGSTTLLATRVTDESGKYAFGGLNAARTYTVKVDTAALPPTVTNCVDPDLAYDSQTDVNLSAYPEGIYLGADFGYAEEDPNTISGTIWEDLDGDGIRELGEPSLTGVTVVLSRSNGTALRTASDADGNYSFSGLPDGTYSLDVTDEANLVEGWWHSDGPDDGADNNSQVLPYSVTVVGGQTDPTGDLGYYQAPAALGNWIWEDTDQDGVQDPTETGIAGVRVILEIGYVGEPLVRVQATTNGDGYYRIDNLLLDESFDATGPGEPAHSVRPDLSSVPGWYAPSPQNATTEDKDSDNPYGEPVDSPEGLSRGVLQDQYDFGFYVQPTKVDLISFTAAWEGDRRVRVDWETAAEIDNLGFNLYRAQSEVGARSRLNLFLISSRVPPGSGEGAEYTWPDDTARAGQVYYYWLEDVDVHGASTLHGPVLVGGGWIFLPMVVR